MSNPPLQLVQYPDTQHFTDSVAPWMLTREAENCHFLSVLPQIMTIPANTTPTFFALTNQLTNEITAAAILFANGCLYLSRLASDQMLAIAQTLHRAHLNLKSVYAPAGQDFAALWATLTQQKFSCARAERLYRLTHIAHTPPHTGHLTPALPDDHPLVTRWLTDFAQETNLTHPDIPALAGSLIAAQELYLWNHPTPVSMAAWVAPTPHSGAINLVYTPPSHRRQGHALAVVSALAQHMLSTGLHFCTILADPHNSQTDHLYRKAGAHPLFELERCPFFNE